MRELPTGTVTFLFTDIEGSTKLLHELGDAYGDALEEHRRTLREAFDANDGVEVDTQGDAFLVAFSRATDAAKAALDGQRLLEASPLRVRMGLHTGEPLIRDGGYVGMDVHRGARVMAAGHGGQIVVSERSRSFLDEHDLEDLGVHRLKDLTGPERLFQLGDGDFPPLRTLDATNLPTTATPILGRERELEELVSLLTNGTRLVTITGPGGTGKTRLALEAAGELVGRKADGVFWVPLAGVSDPELVLPEIAQAVGAGDDLAGFLRGRELVILLDNLEQLLDAAPALSELLGGSKQLRLLVTSRAPLRVNGEHQYPLEPLAPEDSATLFCERARSIGREFSRDETVDAICRRLDGLPLAIELAAARTKLLALGTLRDRLEHTLPLLTSGGRDAPERQRTLRATIEWSYELLDEEARELFSRLAVFAGGFSLAAAEDVCVASLDALAALVDVSLLKTIGGDRFLLLETIHEYAAEMLAASSDAEATRRRHAEYFAELAEGAYRSRVDAEAESAAGLELDHDNLRAALDWFAANNAEGELRLAGALGWFWLSHSHLEEGSRRLAHALGGEQASQYSFARALTAAGGVAGRAGRADEADELFSRSIEQWRAAAEDAELATTLEVFGWSLFFNGANARALDAFEQSAQLWAKLADEGGETRSLIGVCQVLVADGDIDRADPLATKLLDTARRLGDVRSEHFAIHFLADCALMRSDYDDAKRRYQESLVAAVALGDVLEMSLEVQGVAMAAAGKGDLPLSARLGGAVEALWESHGIVVDVAFWNVLLKRHIYSARKELGADGDANWEEGRGIPFDDAVQLALTYAVA